MSTRLLSHPNKVHELCDDLESLWFVLLFEGLHFAKHNKPSGIRMALIFDEVDVSLTTGGHTGGVGKGNLYTQKGSVMCGGLEFESKPFTVLVRQLYRLFQSLDDYYRENDKRKTPSDHNQENLKKLESCVEIERLLTEALGSNDWSNVSDKVEDQYPPVGRRTLRQMDGVALSFMNRSFQSSGRHLKREREEEEDSQGPDTKRLRWTCRC